MVSSLIASKCSWRNVAFSSVGARLTERDYVVWLSVKVCSAKLVVRSLFHGFGGAMAR